MSQNKPQFLSVSEVQTKIINDIQAIEGTEQVALRQSLNRVLAEDIVATFDTPPCDNSGMDGYAFSSNELNIEPLPESLNLHIAGESFAGHPYSGEI